MAWDAELQTQANPRSSRSNAFPSRLPAGSETHSSSPRPSPYPLRARHSLKHTREANSFLGDFHTIGRCPGGASSGMRCPRTVTLVSNAGADMKRPRSRWLRDLGETGAWQSAPRPAAFVKTPNKQIKTTSSYLRCPHGLNLVLKS